MYGKPPMTSFKYQENLYGSEAITYLKAILGGYRASTMSHQSSPFPYYRQPSPLCKKQRENLYG
jgi:hypothetical protein